MKLMCTGLMVMLALVSQAQAGKNQNRLVNNAVRDLQQWQRKQVPTNSVLYKMNYSTMYPGEVSSRSKQMQPAFEAPVYVPGNLQPPQGMSDAGRQPLQQDQYGQGLMAAGFVYQPGIPVHHALMMRRTFLPPPGYKP